MNDLHTMAAFKALDEGRLQPVDKEVTLKPCPFCGERAEVEHSYHEDDNRYPRDFWHVRVKCQGCGIELPDWTSYGNQEQKVANFHVKQAAERDAVSLWNTRHQSGRTGAGEAREVVLFNLTWIAPPSPELPDGRRVHPNPMTGRQSFMSWEIAQAFMSKRCEGSEFVSLTQTTSRTVDRSAEFAAALAQSTAGCPHEAWEDRGGNKCCVDCGLWFDDAEQSTGRLSPSHT